MRILYYIWLSPFARKVRIILREKKLDFSLELEKPWENRPDFLALNPAGEVPVLVDLNGSIIAHHNAITEYLEEAYPEVALLGNNLVERAEIRRLIGWFDEKFYIEVTRNLVFEKVEKRYLGQGGPNPMAIRQGLHNIHAHLEYISWLTDRRNWLAGQHFSLADIAAAAQLSVLDYLGDVPWDKHENAHEWYARIKSRPSFRPLLNDHMPGLTPAPHYHNLDF